MRVFTIVKAAPMGEPDEKFGITYWATVKEGDTPVMFNSHRADMLDGRQIVAEEVEEKESKNGNAYLRLKKVKVGEPANGQEPSFDAPKASPSEVTLDILNHKLDEVIETLNKLVGFDEPN